MKRFVRSLVFLLGFGPLLGLPLTAANPPPNIVFILADDLDTDPGEQHDVSAAHPEIVTRLRRLRNEHLQHVSNQ